MTRIKVFLCVQAVLCILIAVLLSVSAVSIYREGSARKAEDPLESVYTPEKAAGKASLIMPLFFFVAGMTAAGLLLGIRDDKADKPARDACSASGMAVKKSWTVTSSRKKKYPEKTVQIILITAAVIMILMGIFNGSARDVLGKAVNICSECVGLG